MYVCMPVSLYFPFQQPGKRWSIHSKHLPQFLHIPAHTSSSSSLPVTDTCQLVPMNANNDRHWPRSFIKWNALLNVCTRHGMSLSLLILRWCAKVWNRLTIKQCGPSWPPYFHLLSVDFRPPCLAIELCCDKRSPQSIPAAGSPTWQVLLWSAYWQEL